MRILVTALVLLLLQACTALPEASREQSAETSATPPAPAERQGTENRQEPVAEAPAAEPFPLEATPGQPEAPQLSGELLYSLLIAEIAGQRGEIDITVQNYVAAAMLSQDPRIAERATRIAVYARDDVSALAVSRLWVDLEPESTEAHQVVAALLVRNGETDEALFHLEQVIAAGGDQGEHQGYMLVTSLLSKESDKQAAMEVMSKLVAERQESPDAQFAYAQLAALMGELDDAYNAIQRAVELRPEWSKAHMLRANILVRQGRNAEAMQRLDASVREYPKNTELRMFYARMLVDERRLSEAREQFTLLLEASPDNGDAIYALGLLSLQLNELKDAEKRFMHLVKSGQRVNEASYYLGQIEENRRNYDKALRWYGVVRSGQYRVDAQLRISVVLARQGQVEQARERLRNIDTESAEVQLRVYLAEGEILREAKRHQEAFELYSDALRDMPDNSQLLYARALAAEKLDRLDIAEQDLRHILKSDPDNAQALNALGYTLADRSDRLQEALGYIERAHNLRPNDPAVIDSLGWVHYRLGNYEKALLHLRRAFELLKDPEIAAHLGEVLWVTGDHPGAREVWDKGAQSSPGDEILQDVIQRFTK
ncbi:MAG: tetratricopeptide repeat protein [Pseudomonadota bacterium]|nr:MAG: tetratricopeptide repeat protein [Pseudomonadota bacterium]